MSILLHDLVGNDPQRPFSPHCWKAMMALAHKGLDYQRNPVTFTQVASVEGGPKSKVPVLRDGDKVVADSFAIAEYLEDTYTDRPSLFGGEGGRALARFVESWSQTVLHKAIIFVILKDLYERLDPADQAFFRESREAVFGKTLEELYEKRDAAVASFPNQLLPLRVMLSKQKFIGGDTPLFADYIVFSALQWARIMSPIQLIESGDPVADWFERCLDLHGGLGRSVAAAA